MTERFFPLIPDQVPQRNVPGLGFGAQSVVIDNPTSHWWQVSGFPIAPYLVGVVHLLPSTVRVAEIVDAAPGGIQQGVTIAGESGQVRYVDQVLPSAAGNTATPGQNGPYVVGAATSANITGNPITLTVPAAARTGDLIVIYVTAYNNAANVAPTWTVPGGFTTQQTRSQANAAGTKEQAEAILTGQGPGPFTLTFTNATSATAVLLVIRQWTAVGASAAFSDNAGATVVLSAPAVISKIPALLLYIGAGGEAVTPPGSFTLAPAWAQQTVVSDSGGTNISADVISVVAQAVGTAPIATYTIPVSDTRMIAMLVVN